MNIFDNHIKYLTFAYGLSLAMLRSRLERHLTDLRNLKLALLRVQRTGDYMACIRLYFSSPEHCY